MGQRLVPFLGYEDAAAAIDWLSAAFGATENAEARQAGEDGTVWHAELDFEGSTVFLSTPEGYVGSRKHRERCEIERRMHENAWVIDGLFIEVSDVEAHHARAVEGGATVLRAPEEPGIGFRIYTAEDLEGHRWMFGQRLENDTS
ncbi:MAG TPA: VOC family protein [Gaiellaceae bacterium]|nr:VOC family protein [Gaiellaceae bacterium]